MTSVSNYPVVLAFGTALLAATVWAARARPAYAADGEKAAPRVSTLAQRFQSRDQAELLLLLDELSPNEPDARQAARAVSELLAAGQVDVVTDHALESLGRLGAREGRDALQTYTRHRRVAARRRAYTALAQLKDPSVASLEAAGLRDSSPEVRAAAANALGELRASDATGDLLRALGRGVSEAAAAVGLVGNAASVAQFGAYLGKQPLAVMLDGYGNYLQRADLTDGVKLQIVASLENVSGATVKTFLGGLLLKAKPARSAELQRAIVTAIARIKPEPAPTKRTEPTP